MAIVIRKIFKPLDSNYIRLFYCTSRRTIHNISSLPVAESNRFELVQNIKNINKNNYIYFLKRNYSANTVNCWNCQKGTKLKNSFFCENCGSLQNVYGEINYFQLFSLNEQFNVDLNELTTKFHQLQSILHPDKFSNKNEKEQEYSSEWSSLINKAYKTLLAPINRGEYMLKLKGLTVPKDNSVLNKEFLMEMMEKNEEIEEADKNEIFNIKNQIQNDLDETINELEVAFSKNDYEQVKSILIKLKYLKSLENSIKEKITKLCN